jgi:uncharacterized protein YecE (DUF72 family)
MRDQKIFRQDRNWKNSRGHSQLVGSRLCRALVSEKDAGWRAASVVCAAFRNGRGELDLLFGARTENGRTLLPPDLQRRAETDARGNVKSTPYLQEALLKIFLRATSIFHDAGKLGVFLLQLSPAFSSRKHELGELIQLIEMLSDYDLAIEFRNRNWAVGDQLQSTIDFLQKYHAVFVNVDAPASDHFMVMPSDVDEVTNSKVAYLRLHGRNEKAYITGKTVAARFDYDYSEIEIAEVAQRSRELAKEARELHVIFNNNNLDYAPRAALRLRKALGQIVKTPAQTAELF